MADAKNVPAEKIHIAIDGSFQTVAKTLVKVWNETAIGDFFEHGIEGVRVKCNDVESAKVFEDRMLAADLAQQAFFATANPTPNPEKGIKVGGSKAGVNPHGARNLHTTDTKWAYLKTSSFLPRDLLELANDVAKADHGFLKVLSELMTFAETYLAAFDEAVILVELDIVRDTDHGIIETAGDRLRTAQKLLREFLALLVRAKNIAVVTIRQDFTVEINGQAQKIAEAALRALLTLATFRKAGSFGVEDFAVKYNRSKSVDAKNDFVNAMRPLKKIFPKLNWKSSAGIRSEFNIIWQVVPSDMEITAKMQMITRKK